MFVLEVGDHPQNDQHEKALGMLFSTMESLSGPSSITLNLFGGLPRMGEVNIHISIWPPLMMINKKNAFLINMLPTHV